MLVSVACGAKNHAPDASGLPARVASVEPDIQPEGFLAGSRSGLDPLFFAA
jgi:hypothetical protein